MDEQDGVLKKSKDQPSSLKAGQKTSSTATCRQLLSWQQQTGLDTALYLSWSVCSLWGNKGKPLCEPLAYITCSTWIIKICPNLDQRRSREHFKLLEEGQLFWCNVAAPRNGCHVSMYGHLYGMCVHCLWVSESFFCSTFWRRFTFQKNRPFIFCSDLYGFTRENSLSQGLLLKEFIYWFI